MRILPATDGRTQVAFRKLRTTMSFLKNLVSSLKPVCTFPTLDEEFVRFLLSITMKCFSEVDDERREYIRLQRLARRTRAGAACVPCKAKKSRCSDYRPCLRCKQSPAEICHDSKIDNPTSNSSSSHLFSAVNAVFEKGRTFSPVQTISWETTPTRAAYQFQNTPNQLSYPTEQTKETTYLMRQPVMKLHDPRICCCLLSNQLC